MTVVLVCLDSFKGSLDAVAACRAVATGIRHARPDVEVWERPVADGGEGTVAALATAGATVHHTTVSGPTGEPVDAVFAVLGDTVVVELAQAAGLERLPAGPDPMRAATTGVGEVLRAALSTGARRIVLAVGGSAGTDGGAGMLTALGARVLDDRGVPVTPGGGGLTLVARVDLTGLDPRLADVELRVAVDVDNPLLGPDGAAAVYGPQKGAGPTEVTELEQGLERFAAALEAAGGRAMTRTPGAGAAGGAAYGAMAGLGAEPISGARFLLDAVGVPELLPRADLVVVGEGRLDHQSRRGKIPVQIARLARAAGVPVVAVAGRIELSATALHDVGIGRGWALVDRTPDVATAVRDVAALLEDVGVEIGRAMR